MKFICADCYEETEWSEERLEQLYFMGRDPVCLECGSEHVWPATDAQRARLQFRQSLEDLGDAASEALELVARLGTRAMWAWRRLWR